MHNRVLYIYINVRTYRLIHPHWKQLHRLCSWYGHGPACNTWRDPKITGIIFFLMVYWVLYYYKSSLLQSTLLSTRYTCANVFPTAENISGTLHC